MLFGCIFSVKAESSAGIRTTHHLEVNVQPDLSAVATYYLEVFFDSGDGVIRNITTSLPLGATELVLKVNDEVKSPQVTTEDGKTNISLDLGSSAIRPGQANTLVYSFRVAGLVKEQYGLRYLYMAKPTSDFHIEKMSVEIKYPDSFSPPSYTSSQNERAEANSIYLNATNGIFVIWGSESNYGLETDVTTKYTNSSFGLLNLPKTTESQKVTYIELKQGLKLGTNPSGNSYIVLDNSGVEENVTYKAGVKNSLLTKVNNSSNQVSNLTTDSLTSSLTSSITNPIALPAEFKERSVDNALLSEILELVVSKLVPDSSTAVTSDMLSSIGSSRDLKSNSFVYSYLLSGYLKDIGVGSEIRYGYIIFPDLQGLDITKPISWVVADFNDELLLLDPYLYDIFGYQTTPGSNLNRLTMGTWKDSSDLDVALGLLSASQITRPQVLSKVDGINWEEINYTLSLFLPSKAYAGELYDGQLRVQNTTNYIISPSSFTIDNVDHLGYLSLGNDIWTAFPPKSDTAIMLNGLREPNFLFDGVKTRVARVASFDESIPDTTSSATVMITVDERLLLVIFAVLLAIWLVVIVSFTKNKHLYALKELLGVSSISKIGKKLSRKNTKRAEKNSTDSSAKNYTSNSNIHHVRTWK